MRFKKYINHFKLALLDSERDYTQGNIKLAIFYLAVPMVLEMMMESLFAVIDIFFVGRISVHAVATVGLTESVLTILYAVAIGLSMGATATVARRIGEKKPKKAADAAFQVILLGAIIAVIVGVSGVVFAKDLLRLMGGEDTVINEGYGYTRIIFGGNVSIVLLFLINGVFRGAGNAAIAMRTLWLANGINIVLDPILIFGLGPIPALGLEGAAWATTIGRSCGVLYQVYHLLKGSGKLVVLRENVVFRLKTILTLIRISGGGMGQFLIESASWIFLMRIVSYSGSTALAGTTIAMRVMMFTIMPAFGISNAAATLVGQNLGAGQPQRAEDSAWLTARYAAVFMGLSMLFFLSLGEPIIGLFNSNPEVVKVGSNGLLIMCLGYIFFAYGMVMVQSLNGAGDTKTPMYINIVVLWVIQLPLAYFLSVYMNWAAVGVFITIAFAHSFHALCGIYFFRRGKWKETVV